MKLGTLLFGILINSLLKDWSERMKFVDDTSALAIVPIYSPSLIPFVVNSMSDFASRPAMRLNHKKCKHMLISFLKQKESHENLIFVARNTVKTVEFPWCMDIWNNCLKKGKFSLIRIAFVKEGQSSTIRYCSQKFFCLASGWGGGGGRTKPIFPGGGREGGRQAKKLRLFLHQFQQIPTLYSPLPVPMVN